jgi:hypothetical protein
MTGRTRKRMRSPDVTEHEVEDVVEDEEEAR